MKTPIAYVLMILGLLVIAISFQPIRDAAGLVLPPAISETYVIIAGVVLAAIGVFMLSGKRKGREKISEVPIYHGKDVVGFRRIKNK